MANYFFSRILSVSQFLPKKIPELRVILLLHSFPSAFVWCFWGCFSVLVCHLFLNSTPSIISIMQQISAAYQSVVGTSYLFEIYHLLGLMSLSSYISQ